MVRSMEAIDHARPWRSSAAVRFVMATLTWLSISLLVVYPSAYLAMGEHSSFETPDGDCVIVRSFPQRWQVEVFRPAARLEGCLRSAHVFIKGDWVRAGVI